MILSDFQGYKTSQMRFLIASVDRIVADETDNRSDRCYKMRN